MLRSIYIILVSTLFLSDVGAQSKVIGYVYDASDSKELIGAHVRILSDWRNGVVTDTQGKFELSIEGFSGIDSMYVIVSFVGYKEALYKLGLNIDNHIYLNPSISFSETIVVEASEILYEEFASEKIGRLEIYKNPNAKADPLLAVNSLASTTPADESANIRFRGASPVQTGVFFNGVPLYDVVKFSQLNGLGTFSIFNTELINSVQVFAGNPPLEFGNTTSGLVSITSSNQVPENFGGSVLVSPASFGVNLKTSIKKNLGIHLYTNYQPSEILKFYNSEGLKDINSFESIDFGAHLVYRQSDESTLKMYQYILNERYDYNFKSASYSGYLLQNRNKSISILNYQRSLSKGQININGAYTHTDFQLSYSAFNYDVTTENYFLSISYKREKRKTGFKMGLEYDSQFSNFEGIVPQLPYALRPEHPTISANALASRNQLEPYIGFKYLPSKFISFSYSVRTNIPVINEKSYLSYQSNIKYNSKNGHTFIFSGSQLNQLLVDQQSFEKGLITSRQYSLDHNFTRKKWSIESALFTNELTGFLTEQRLSGIEISLRRNFIRSSFIQFSGTGLLRDRKFDESRKEYFLRLFGEWNLGGNFTVNFSSLYRSSDQFIPVENAIYQQELNVFRPIYGEMNSISNIPDYFILDVGLSKLFPFNQNLIAILFLNVSNITDHENTRSYYYNFDYSNRNENYFGRRLVYVGVQINFQ